MKSQTAIEDIQDELKRARSKFPNINNPHEGYAVILEELDEAWDEIKVKQSLRNSQLIRQELIKVAAMAIRTIEDCKL